MTNSQICQSTVSEELREGLSHPLPVTATGASLGGTTDVESEALPSQLPGEKARQIESEAMPSQLSQGVSESEQSLLSESVVIKHFSESESLAKSQQGRLQPDGQERAYRLCQSDFPKATGASLGKTMPLRTLSIFSTTDVTKIWEEAERRLGTSRRNFSLVRSGSRYLPPDGVLESPEQLFEIRWQGRGGTPDFEIQVRVRGKSWVEPCSNITTLRQFLKQIGAENRADQTVRIGDWKFHGPLDVSELEDVVMNFYPADHEKEGRIKFTIEDNEDEEEQTFEDSVHYHDSDECLCAEEIEDDWDRQPVQVYLPDNDWLTEYKENQKLSEWTLRECKEAKFLCGSYKGFYCFDFSDMEYMHCGDVFKQNSQESLTVWICRNQADVEEARSKVEVMFGKKLSETEPQKPQQGSPESDSYDTPQLKIQITTELLSRAEETSRNDTSGPVREDALAPVSNGESWVVLARYDESSPQETQPEERAAERPMEWPHSANSVGNKRDPGQNSGGADSGRRTPSSGSGKPMENCECSGRNPEMAGKSDLSTTGVEECTSRTRIGLGTDSVIRPGRINSVDDRQLALLRRRFILKGGRENKKNKQTHLRKKGENQKLPWLIDRHEEEEKQVTSMEDREKSEAGNGGNTEGSDYEKKDDEEEFSEEEEPDEIAKWSQNTAEGKTSGDKIPRAGTINQVALEKSAHNQGLVTQVGCGALCNTKR
jgi:hypothetical protein